MSAEHHRILIIALLCRCLHMIAVDSHTQRMIAFVFGDGLVVKFANSED